MKRCLPVLAAIALMLSGCGATAVIPVEVATAETATTPTDNQLAVMVPEDSDMENVWPVLVMVESTAETAASLPQETILEVENISQNPELPNGCEITSAAIVLRYLGFDIDKVTLAENYLPMHIPYWEADPEVEFMGNPADALSFYCLPGAIVTAVNDYLADVGSDYVAIDISGASVEELYQWVAKGSPVLIWTTLAFSDPVFNYTFQLPDGNWPYGNSHCLVLTGYDEENCYLADPLQLVEEFDRNLFAYRYEERGQYAVVITKEDQLQ